MTIDDDLICLEEGDSVESRVYFKYLKQIDRPFKIFEVTPYHNDHFWNSAGKSYCVFESTVLGSEIIMNPIRFVTLAIYERDRTRGVIFEREAPYHFKFRDLEVGVTVDGSTLWKELSLTELQRIVLLEEMAYCGE